MSCVLSSIVPGIILLIIIFALFEKKDVLKLFADGVIDGLKTVVKIFPNILAITIAVNLLNNSNAISILLKPLNFLLSNINIPEAIIPLVILKPLSGSAATSIVLDMITTYGVDSEIAKMASLILSSTETTFYVIAVLLSVVNIKRKRGVTAVAIFADVLVIAMASLFVIMGWF